jgi:hypothetical protein
MGIENDGLSQFEKFRIDEEKRMQEIAWHAFSSDYREWGWFDPTEWYAGHGEMTAAGF